MKRFLFASMGMVALCMVSYAATFMRVVQTDGNVMEYDVESVSLVDFIIKEIPSDTTPLIPSDTTPLIPSDTTPLIPSDTTPLIPSDTTPLIPSDTSTSNHVYVDLGLPSGTLWATYNVGASKPEEYGYYFAWGETKPKGVYDWNTFKYATSEKGYLETFTKYNISARYGEIDSLLVLLPEDDAAMVNWGKDWRMPTHEEQRELVENSYMVWTYGYIGTNVRGVLFYKAKKEDDKGKYVIAGQIPSSDYSDFDVHIFLPIAGSRWHDELLRVGNYTSYRSSSLDEESSSFVHGLDLYEDGVSWHNCGERYYGFPVRAVRAK